MRIRWRGLELPSIIVSDRETLTDTYGKFTVEPFERGFGTTIGNSLRRVLLASLEGSAVTRVKIAGVQHEFSTIPGVVEDVTEIILNIKSLVLKNHTDEEKTIRIDRSEAGVVTAADIMHDESVEVIDPEHVIATMTDDVHFSMEMTVNNGRGYVPTEEADHGDQEIGVIPIDSAFSPVHRVTYKIEEARIGQKTNYDRLNLDIWTNGTITPEMALVEAAKILRKHLNPFVQYSEPGPEVPIDPESAPFTKQQEYVDPEFEAKLNMSLAELELSVRATNCLESEGITTVRELLSRDEERLLQVRNFGETTLREVREKLKKFNLHLGMSLPQTAQD
ncbi:DNA-directed RNA polymerase subunit alpha [Planctomycetes bacterium Pan216]|uniref:DNA-directed RNA polymerase subunit alpha n=1 Tax=Kolteria novifilia TaxID=2527975 RepID=A0A518AZR3_9BACT|nr:DNA-directed RNA polymerase subunit alpha [Planctomycetes bacterium Pan216]